MTEIDPKDVQLYNEKEAEFKETLKRIKSKREEYDKIFFNSDIIGIKSMIEDLKKKTENIKNNIENHLKYKQLREKEEKEEKEKEEREREKEKEKEKENKKEKHKKNQKDKKNKK